MLTTFINIAVLLVAVLHLWFFILEAFLWQKPIGLKIFKLPPDFAKKTAALAANQGLYNSFLSAGLIWSLVVSDPVQALYLKIFFLSCVFLAGVFGAITVSFRILLVQALPAGIILILLLL